MKRTIDPPLVVVTGAAGGVGAATVARLRAGGMRVVALDVRGADDALTDGVIACDVTDAMALCATVARIVDTLGVPDVWVNNAGVGVWGPFDAERENTEEMAVNYHGSVNGIRAILPHWRRRGRGHLIQMSSSSALFPAPNMATYAASKAAIRAFVQSLRVELRGSGIAITEIVPNTIATAMSAGQNRRWIPRVAGIRPDLRPEEVAQAIQRAIAARPREVQLPRLVTPFYWLATFAPALVDWLVAWGNPAIRKGEQL